MDIGNRIVYNPETGTILNNCLCAMSGNIQTDLRPATIGFIDLPVGSTILTNVATFHIDITKDVISTQPEQMIVVDSTIPDSQPTYEQLQQELLQAQGVI